MVQTIDAVGCDENMSAAETEASSQRASDRKKEERDHQKKELHQYKKAERQDIRDKYQLKSGNSQAQNSSSARKQETESKSCSIS